MARRYYLCTFVGMGTDENPFTPMVSLHTPRWGMIDFREDQTKSEGWCFAYAEVEDHTPIEQLPRIVSLGEDPDTVLPKATRDRLKKLLHADFLSGSLADIIIELLLSSSDFKPTNGKYQVHLGGLLKELTEDEAEEFIGRIIISREQAKTFHLSAEPLKDLVPHAIKIVRSAVGSEWLENERSGSEASVSHILVQNVRAAQKHLAEGDESLKLSHAVRWLITLAQDITLIGDKIDHLGSRLRNPNDCEAVKYEAKVLATYLRAGEEVRVTDLGKAGEFCVTRGITLIHIECKLKTKNSVRDRRIHEAFKGGTYRLKDIMENAKAFADVRVIFRSDPTDQAIEEIVQKIGGELKAGTGVGNRFQKKGIKIEVLPYHSTSAIVPRGYDFGACGAEVLEVKEDGVPVIGNLWSIAWRSCEPTGWIKSALSSLKQAAKQLPSEGPGLIYLQLPASSEEMLVGRMELLLRRIPIWLSNNRRINAVILTGEIPAIINHESSQLARMKYRYQVIKNQSPRNPLPDGFEVRI
jgi:hypothetical protein